MIKEFLERYYIEMNALAKDDLEFLGFSPNIGSDGLNSLFKTGFWHILFIGSDKFSQYGLRILPDKKWQEWPLVRMNSGHSCSTIGTGFINLFEFFKFDRLSPGFGLAEYYCRTANKFQQIMEPLDQVFKNKDGMGFFDEFVRDIKRKNENIDEKKADKLIIDFWKHFNDTESEKLLRTLISRMKEDDEYFPVIDTSINYGIWQTRIYHMLMCKLQLDDAIKEGKVGRQFLINCFDEPHCIDTETLDVEQKSNNSCDPIYENLNFAEIVMDYPEIFGTDNGGDPIYHVIKALYENGKHDYTGVEHAEIAAILDDQYNAPLRSWNALINAAYWSGRNMEESLFPTWEAAIGLCKRNNWADAQYALEYQMGVYKGMK